MKNSIIIFSAFLSISFGFAQVDSNPVTGDNFSLEGALAMFKKANSLENFEQLLNEQDNNVNNLDLNNDGNTDYINVDDIREGDNHVIVLSTFINETEKQDIATIGIEKTGIESATLQIEGDLNLYAENTIVEPFETSETLDKNSKGGPNFQEVNSKIIFVNVWFWPSIRFIYAPNYVVWVSQYRWGMYPRWWRPWKPFRQQYFYSRSTPHRIYYRPTPNRRLIYVRKIYAPRRQQSSIVVRTRQTNIKRNNYNRTNNRSTNRNLNSANNRKSNSNNRINSRREGKNTNRTNKNNTTNNINRTNGNNRANNQKVRSQGQRR